MRWPNWLISDGKRQRFSQRIARSQPRRAVVETLEGRMLLTAVANLTAYRPVTEYINYAQYAVPEAQETSPTLGPGIRFNGDDDNANGIADNLDSAATAAENDLVRLDVNASGGDFSLAWSAGLQLWTSSTKAQAVVAGQTYPAGQVTWWVEDVSPTPLAPASVVLTVGQGTDTAQDVVDFHSFQSDVIAIGGNQQNPANVGDPRLGVFTIGLTLYQQGYDVHLVSYDKVAANGQGAAFNEVKNAVLKRNVANVGIVGYSWGGGATYQLAAGLNADTALKSHYRLSYTAYIDGIRQGSISAEIRLPTGTLYHDNLYQRKDFLVKGNSVTGAANVNVTSTTWGSSLVHTTIDDNAMVQSILVSNLKLKMVS
jgi:hypothetical protein